MACAGVEPGAARQPRALALGFLFCLAAQVTGNMLYGHHLRKAFGLDLILDDVSISLGPGDRAGLVGPNGCGKTTLLRLLAGVERPDAGSVQATPSTLAIGYLPQGLEIEPGQSLADFVARAAGDVPEATARVERLAAALMYGPGRPNIELEYDTALADLAAAVRLTARVPQVLGALGIDGLPPGLLVSALSGGQKTRLALASVLLAEPDVLLLDEPTNHLDIAMLEWLEDWLNAYRGAALIVSHDRAFLDRTARRIHELDPATHRVREYGGNYSDYVAEKESEHERTLGAYADQQEEIHRLRNTARELRGIARLRKGGKADDGDKYAKGFFGNRSAGTVGRAKHIEARLERLLTDEHLDKPKLGWQMKLDFGAAPASGQDVLMLEGLAVGYAAQTDVPGPAEAGPRILLRDLNVTVRHGARVALIGPNGSGKTTMLRTVAGLLAPLAGRARLGANVRLGYMAQEQEMLDPALDALDTIRRAAPLTETDARSFLHYFLFTGDGVFVPVGSLSFGERSRLALATLVAQGRNLLLLDEPINHLDIPSRARFEQALAGFDGTVVAVVHDRYFVAGFATEIWEVVDGTILIQHAG
jgi:ATP-binding cassette subfamily F protein 3